MPEGVGPDAVFTALSGQITDLGKEIGGLRHEIGDIKGTVGEVKTAQEKIEEDVSDIKESIHGNGDKGLVTRMTVMETKTAALPDPTETSVALQVAKNSSNGLKAKWIAIEKISGKIFKVVILIIAIKYGYNEFVIGDTKVKVGKSEKTPVTNIDNQ